MASVSRFRAGLVLAGLLVALAGASEPAPVAVDTGKEQGAEQVAVAPDDDPRVYDWEVVAPAIDSSDPAWVPAYARFEDPESIKCEGRRTCDDLKAEEVSKAETETTGALR